MSDSSKEKPETTVNPATLEPHHAGPFMMVNMSFGIVIMMGVASGIHLDNSLSLLKTFSASYAGLIYLWGLIWFIQRCHWLGLSVSRLLLTCGSVGGATLGLVILNLDAQHEIWLIVSCFMWGWFFGQILSVWMERDKWVVYFRAEKPEITLA